MNLVIDIGNTRVKAAFFDNDAALVVEHFPSIAAFMNSGFADTKTWQHCILGTVVDQVDELTHYLKSRGNVLIFSSATPVPLINSYKSAHTLGSDRLAAAVAGNFLAPDQPVLVIDTGTCIKYNFVNAQNAYLGGAISPGLSMRLKAMHTFTDRLPFLEADPAFFDWIGTDTRESMLAGAQNGAAREMDGFIDDYRSRFNNLKVFLTGGDTDFFAKRLKNTIFADPNLILKGLNRILSHNR